MFVDQAGRRHRWVKGAGVAVALGSVGYVVLLGASLARAPWVPRVSVPGLGSVLPPQRAERPPSLGPGALASPAPLLPSSPTTLRRGGATTAPPSTRPPKAAGATTTASAPTTTATTRPGRGRATTTVPGGPTTTRHGRP